MRAHIVFSLWIEPRLSVTIAPAFFFSVWVPGRKSNRVPSRVARALFLLGELVHKPSSLVLRDATQHPRWTLNSLYHSQQLWNSMFFGPHVLLGCASRAVFGLHRQSSIQKLSLEVFPFVVLLSNLCVAISAPFLWLRKRYVSYHKDALPSVWRFVPIFACSVLSASSL